MKKDENKVYANPQYKCAVCGTIYDEIQARTNCEMKCIKKKQEEEKKAAEAKKKAEKEARKKEVNEAFENALKLRDAYAKDYGYYEYERNDAGIKVTNLPYLPSRIWHDFLF